MSNLNTVILQGNLTADPELVGAEKNVARFTVAVNHGFGDNEDTAFIPCVAFGKQAGIIAKYFEKGRQIIVRGTLVQNKWQNEAGENRSRLEVRLNTFEGFHFVGNGGGGQRSEASGESAPADEPQPAGATEGGNGEGGDLF